MKLPETHKHLEPLVEELTKHKIPFKSTKDGLLVRCIFHTEKTPSLGVSLNGKYHCFGCGKAGDVKEIFQYFGLKAFTTKTDEFIFAKERLLDLIATKLRLNDELLPKDMKLIDFEYRGIPVDTLQKFKVFLSKDYPDSVCVPLYFKGKLYAILERTLLEEKLPKYKVHLFGRYMYPFPLDNINTSSVFIVEGIFDFFAMYEAGFKNTIAIFGTSNTYHLKRLLLEKNIRHIILVMDGDDAGYRATERISSYFTKGVKVDSIFMPPSLDPASHPDLKNYICDQLQKKNLA